MNTTPTDSNPPTAPRRKLGWRILRASVFTVVGLVTLVALVLTEENWRGKRAWENYRREWEAQGEKFDWSALAHKPVPDDQNFLRTPYLAAEFAVAPPAPAANGRSSAATSNPHAVNISYEGAKEFPAFGNYETGEPMNLRQWQEFYRGTTNFLSPPQPGDPARDVLIALAKFDPVLQELRAASQRPYAVLVSGSEPDLQALMPCFSALKRLSQWFRLHATASLSLGEGNQALQDVQLSFRLADSLNSAPILISHLVRLAMLSVASGSVWEGIALHRWTDAQLIELQKLIGGIDLFAEYGHVMRGERAYGFAMFARLRTGRLAPETAGVSDDVASIMHLAGLSPSGWLYQNQASVSRLFQDHIFGFVDSRQHRVFPGLCRQFPDSPELRRSSFFNLFARLLAPAIAKAASKTARQQTVLDEALVACGLERYRLAEGRYPDQLQALVPRFLDRLPTDVINAQPLKYRRTDDGGYLLYSVGWNEKDDGGVRPAKQSASGSGAETGDWVWRVRGQ